jgi:hypothetical protein
MHKISQQLALACGGLCLLACLALVLVGNLSSRFILEQQQDDHGTTLAEQLARELASTVATGDLVRLEVKLRQMREQYSLAQILVLDLEGAPLGHAGDNGSPGNLKYRSNLSIDGHIAGELSLLIAPGPALLEQQRMSWGLLFLACLLSVFAAALALSWGQKLAGRLNALDEALTLEESTIDIGGEENELAQLEATVAQLPLELLRSPEPEEAHGVEYRDASLLYLRLDSLANYVDTLDENSLLTYTDLLRRTILGAAQIYDGELAVVRQFGLLVSFSGEHAAGSPAFRAVSTAALIFELTRVNQAEGKLRRAVSQAIGVGESGVGSAGDIYPDLYNQHIIDQLAVMTESRAGAIVLGDSAAEDPEVRGRCRLSDEDNLCVLSGLEEPYHDLMERQRELLLRKLQA